MKVEISNGEIVDKWTILTIKLDRIQSEEAQANIRKELGMIEEHIAPLSDPNLKIWRLAEELWTVNVALWDVEDKLRLLESEQSFDEEFIEAARSVYLLNDDRARIKREINEQTDSPLVEEKSYPTYEVPTDD